MVFWIHAGRAFITKDHTEQPVAHTGRAADILRIVTEALKEIAAKDVTSGQIIVDFGATEATARVQKNLPRIRFENREQNTLTTRPGVK